MQLHRKNSGIVDRRNCYGIYAATMLTLTDTPNTAAVARPAGTLAAPPAVRPLMEPADRRAVAEDRRRDRRRPDDASGPASTRDPLLIDCFEDPPIRELNPSRWMRIPILHRPAATSWSVSRSCAWL